MSGAGGAPAGKHPSDREEAPPPRTFGATLARVMAVQVIALLLLWLLQARYTG